MNANCKPLFGLIGDARSMISEFKWRSFTHIRAGPSNLSIECAYSRLCLLKGSGMTKPLMLQHQIATSPEPPKTQEQSWYCWNIRWKKRLGCPGRDHCLKLGILTFFWAESPPPFLELLEAVESTAVLTVHIKSKKRQRVKCNWQPSSSAPKDKCSSVSMTSRPSDELFFQPNPI